MDEIETKMRLKLIEVISKLVFEDESDLFGGAWHGGKHAERMADAALAVHMANIEGQKAQEDNE